MKQESRIKKAVVFIAISLIVVGVFWFGRANNASAAGGVVISEIQLNDNEFIELYNSTTQTVDISSWYWTYFSAGRNWNNPYRVKKFPTNAQISSGGYYLIGLKGYSIPVADWVPYTSNQLNDSAGAVGIFPWDPSDKTAEEAQLEKIDVIAWGNDNLVKESNNALVPSINQSLERKPGNGAGNGDDTNNNENDFFISTPNPQNSGLTISAAANANSSTNTNIANSNSSTNTNSTNSSASSWPILSNIIFNEVYPNPPDESTEFIELKNASGFAGSPLGWKIKDAAGDEYAIPDKEIADGALWIIPKLESGISLNNDGETLTLINPSGAAFAALAIPSAFESQSYARSGAESFEWTTTLTAGAENIFTQNVSAQGDSAARVNANSPGVAASANNSNASTGANANASANANTNAASSKDAADFSAIKLSEIMPNPEGDDADGEWIELYNGGGKETDLAGGILSDASGKKYAFPKNTIIAAKSYKAFYRKQTNIVLNNDQDTIDLKDSSGKKIDSVNYSEGLEGKSYSRASGGWQWSDPTLEKANYQNAETNINANGNTNTNTIKRIGATINEAKNEKSGAIITVSGIVTAAFGEISKNTFYIQDETGGIAIISESGVLEISRGDFIVIKGKIKTSGGEKMLSAENEKQITVQSSGNNSAAWQMNIADIDSQSLGLFIGVSGKAVQLNDNGFVIDDGSGSLAVLLPAGTNAEKDQMASVQGILKKTKDGIVLALRDKNDFISGNVLGESDKNLPLAGNGKKYDIIIQLLIIVITLLLGGWAARKYLQKYSYATSDTKPAEESKEDRNKDSGFGI